MAGIGKAIKGLGLLAKKYKKAVTKKAAIQTGKRNIESKKLFEKARARSKEKASEMGWKKNLKERSRVFKEGQDRMKGLEKQIESGVVDRNVKSKDVFKIIKGLKKGGSDKKWIQKAVNPKHKGYCTPMTKKTCTPARKALARTFKKKAKTGW